MVLKVTFFAIFLFFFKFVILLCQRHYFSFFFDFNLAEEPYKKPPKCLGSQDICEGTFFLFWENKHFENTQNWKHFVGQCTACKYEEQKNQARLLTQAFHRRLFYMFISGSLSLYIDVLCGNVVLFWILVMVLSTCNPPFASWAISCLTECTRLLLLIF